MLMFYQSLLGFFHADGEGMTMESLQNAKYREIMSLRLFYDWHTYGITFNYETSNLITFCSDQLMMEAVTMMQHQLRAAPTIKKRAKSVYSQRHVSGFVVKKRRYTLTTVMQEFGYY